MISSILKYSFLQNSLFAGLILGVVLPIVGLIILLRKMPFIADALGHINMSSIAFLYLLNSFFAVSQFTSLIIVIMWSILGSILIEFLSQKYTHYKEVSIMLVYSIAISFTIIFLNMSTGFNDSFFNVLFGNINGISDTEVITIFIAAILIIITVFINYKKILIISIDNELAKLYGVKLKQTRYLIMILISLVITMAIKVLGVLLVSSLTLIPNLAAMKLAKSLKQAQIIAIIMTEISVVLGIIISYYLNVSSSAIIVLISVIIYAISVIKSSMKKI